MKLKIQVKNKKEYGTLPHFKTLRQRIVFLMRCDNMTVMFLKQKRKIKKSNSQRDLVNDGIVEDKDAKKEKKITKSSFRHH